MDVEMPRLDGFGAAEAIRAVDADVVLVFVTNMAQYAIRGYEVDALDYVLKPVNYYQFCTKLSRAIQRVQRRRGGQVVLQLAGGGIQLLDTADIYYLETHSRMLYYHTSKGEFAARASCKVPKSSLPSIILSAATNVIWSIWPTLRALKTTLPCEKRPAGDQPTAAHGLSYRSSVLHGRCAVTTSLLNSLLRALLRWGAALVFCLPLRHRSHFWARACGMLLPLLCWRSCWTSGTVHNTVAAAAPAC